MFVDFEYIVLMQGFFVGTEHDELGHGGSKEKEKQLWKTAVYRQFVSSTGES